MSDYIVHVYTLPPSLSPLSLRVYKALEYNISTSVSSQTSRWKLLLLLLLLLLLPCLEMKLKVYRL